ncbi:Na/Pi cotransporter family protein [Jeotgalicoccus meleagridis]|uniref:Na+/Pi-cotransporter n=1 Tax=Jeotgalicoccus meleagridis TaxID=2759181 RepID=A0A6V7R0Z3_9STAP|nr:Na/Pi cotransporter family protein [Jeotgalicoccus meleagridis]CAD2071021.1 Na+/Pi-cotransporter [Jeotgalicoccus meleagridis]
MSLSPTEVLFMFLGGLGIFLYGIKQMGDGLQAAAGDRLREILNRMTSNPIKGVIAGIAVTALIQSSSGTTAITIGLVSAGFLSLRQAIGIILGANIGTTVTAFIIGLDIGAYSLPILAIGSFMLFFFNNQQVVNIGRILFGFGALFYGLELMGDGVKPLADLEYFQNLMLAMSDNSFLGLGVGILLTVIVQSSSATIAILQNFYANDLVDLQAALPILLGDNIGTTITAVLAALVGSLAAKRAAMVHVTFNVIGAIIFMALMPLFIMYVDYLQEVLNLNKAMTIAFAHGSYNVINTLIHLPFVGVLAWIVIKIVPGRDFSEDFQPKHLDPLLLKQSANIAVQSAQSEVKNLGQLVLSTLQDARNYSDKQDIKLYKQIEDKINVAQTLQDSIRSYLIDISKGEVSQEDSERVSNLLEISRILLKVSVQAKTLADQYHSKYENNIQLSEDATEGLEHLYNHVYESFTMALDSIDVYNPQALEHIIRLSQKSNRIENKLRKEHVKRLSRGECSTDGGALYVDLISNLERIGYNARNISETNLSSLHEDFSDDFTVYD